MDPSSLETAVAKPADELCGVEAVGLARANPAEATALRREPGPLRDIGLPHGILRHADDQTVLGLSALLRAVADSGRRGEEFRDWGVVFAPRFLGRANIIRAIERFARTGIAGVSPLIVPHLSLHSPAGTLSLALKMHGPNFGVGGGHDHVGEGFLAAFAVLAEGTAPGLWLVLTAWQPDWAGDGPGSASDVPTAHAVALGLVSPMADSAFVLRWRPGSSAGEVWPRATPSAASVADLAAFLAEPVRPSWGCALSGGEIQLAARDRTSRVFPAEQVQRLAG